MTDQGKGAVKAAIERKLKAALAPLSLAVIDESHHHAGHGHPGDARHGNESHFRVEVVSAAFEDKSRIERHRLVNTLLAQELAEGLHALAISARTPAEAE